MTEIRSLTQFTMDDLRHLVLSGYTSSARYQVRKNETDEITSFTLELVQLDTPYVKYDKLSDEVLLGIALAEVQTWSNRLWVWEFYIDPAYRGQGIGTQLMGELILRNRQRGLRAILLETQTTNVPAIRFYRKMGFTLDGIHLSQYSNNDYPDDEICLYMMRNLQD